MNDLEKDIEASTAAIDDMVKQVTKSLFIDTATAYVVGDSVSQDDLSAAIQAAVTPRLQTLNGTFLPIINSYIEDIQGRNLDQERDSILGILLSIKAEVLTQLGESLPFEMKVIQRALDAKNSDARMAVLREACTNPSANPRCDPGGLALTVSRMIEDFEGTDTETVDEIPDRSFLARMCLLREELRQVADEAAMLPRNRIPVQGSTSGSGNNQVDVDVEIVVDDDDDDDEQQDQEPSTSRRDATTSPYVALRGVPVREVAFLKEVIKVGSSERRRALLEASFRGNLTSSGVAGAGIRPGAFMDCLKALQAEMAGPKFDSDGSNAAILVRLEDVWRESVVVLQDIAGDAEAEYSP